jgi:hypothetical protein
MIAVGNLPISNPEVFNTIVADQARMVVPYNRACKHPAVTSPALK